MYYIAKLAQASGLTVILIGFIKNFPHLMSHQTLMIGVIVFLFGWIIDAYLLKHD